MHMTAVIDASSLYNYSVSNLCVVTVSTGFHTQTKFALTFKFSFLNSHNCMCHIFHTVLCMRPCVPTDVLMSWEFSH